MVIIVIEYNMFIISILKLVFFLCQCSSDSKYLIALLLLLQSICTRYLKLTSMFHQIFVQNLPEELNLGLEDILNKCSRLGNKHIDEGLLYDFKVLLAEASLL